MPSQAVRLRRVNRVGAESPSDRALAFRHAGPQYWAVERRGRISPRTGRRQCRFISILIRCSFGKTRRRHLSAPDAGMRCGLPASSRQCGRCLGWPSTYAEAADTSEPPNASPIPHHRSGFDRRAAYEFPCSAPALANADDPNMDDQPKTRLICRRCAARMKLARQLPWLDHRLPAILLFQCIDCGHVDMVEWPEPEGE